jgi:hypothetical protein
MRKVYFAHPITDYGTERQAVALRALRKELDDICQPHTIIENPDQPHHQKGYAAHGMDYFRGVVDECWSLAFMRFPDGSIGAGVAREIQWASADGKTIWEVFGGKVYRPVYWPITPVLSVEDTRAVIGSIRAALGVA